MKIAAMRVKFLIAVKVYEIPPLRPYELKDPLYILRRFIAGASAAPKVFF